MTKPFLTESQHRKCESFLTNAVNKTEAIFALLSNPSGIIVSHVIRDIGNCPISLEEFSILTAANISAVSEIAKSVGEDRGFSSMLLEGEKFSHYILPVNNQYLLQFLFPTSVKAGKVRYYASLVQQSLVELLVIDNLTEDLTSIFDDDYFSLLEKQIEQALSSMSNDSEDNNNMSINTNNN